MARRIAPKPPGNHEAYDSHAHDSASLLTSSPTIMSGSKYAYVKGYELPDTILPNTYIVVRIDGHAFHW